MKLRGLMLAVVTFSLMVTVAAFARDKNHHSVVIPETLQVGTTRLAPGEYTMQWTESGATAEVSFVQNGKSVAQAPAKIVNLARPSASDSLTTRTATGNAVYSPMYSGLLSGGMTRQRVSSLAAQDWRLQNPNFREPLLSRNLRLVELLKEVG
jgi:hypothetical protein